MSGVNEKTVQRLTEQERRLIIDALMLLAGLKKKLEAVLNR
jgi:hypothetical protein